MSCKNLNNVPIDQSDDDDRPMVKDLLHGHSTEVEKIKECIQSNTLYNASVHDSLWILRFLLDHKNVKDAVKAAEYTLEFRKQNNVDALGDIRQKRPKQREEGEAVPLEHERNFYDYWEKDSLFHTIPDPNRGVVSFILFCGLDGHDLVNTMSEEQQLKEYIYLHEWFYQTLDDITRRTGRLTKLLRIVDMKGMSMGKMSRAYLHRDARINKQIQEIYPQLLGSMLIVNSPSWFQSIWNALRHILPRRMVEKMNFVNPSKRQKDVEIIMKYISREHLPTKYGGKSEIWPPLG